MVVSLFCKQKSFVVYGPKGGLSTSLVLPDGFDVSRDKCHLVVMMHGFLSNKNRYPLPMIARALSKIGVASLSFDFDGNGRSEGQHVNMKLSDEIADARAVVEYSYRLPFVSGVSLLGHSQGGVVAGMLAGQLEDTQMKPLSLIMLAPAAVLKDDALAGRCMGARYDASNPPEYVNVLFHKLGKEFILEAQRLPVYESSGRYSGNVCLIQGSKDAIVPLKYFDKYCRIYTHPTVHIVEDENHMFLKHKRELVHLITSFISRVLLLQ